MSAEHDFPMDFEDLNADDFAEESELDILSKEFAEGVMFLANKYYKHLVVEVDVDGLLNLSERQLDSVMEALDIVDDAQKKLLSLPRNASRDEENAALSYLETAKQEALIRELNRQRIEDETRHSRQVVVLVKGKNQVLVSDFLRRVTLGADDDEKAWDRYKISEAEYVFDSASYPGVAIGLGFYHIEVDLPEE